VAATVGGLLIAIAAALAVPATFRLVQLCAEDDDTAFCAASYMSLCPSLILFLPQFDQVYATLAAVILVLFVKTVKRGSMRSAVALGAVMAPALFCSYIFLILGMFMVSYWLLMFIRPGPQSAGRAAIAGAICAVTLVSLYALLQAVTGFDPIATYHSIATVQAKDLLPLIRPFPRHIFFDVLDFLLGAGWIAGLLTLFLIIRLRGRLFDTQPSSRLAVLALLQIGTVALAALLPGETARLWLPMMPLLMALTGLELRHWPMRHRSVAYACLWVLLVALCQNMTFIYMGPELDGPRW